ncbi:hypothetical protein C3V36_11685 [Lachnospiraceae bacterium oral taxon 500]|nr:hypothetical protein C3V36_11685 [Lachnospiraceae bacterium oral taxon 500]
MIENRKKMTALAARYPDISLPALTYPAQNPLFLDIETTGFSPQNAMIYAIGCVYRHEGEFYFHQLLAEQMYEEDQLLITLEKIIQTNAIDLLVHFNGKNFDIPFLIGRYGNACLSTSLGELPQLDFYLEWKKCRPYFDLPNAKLKTIEQAVKLHRHDEKSGGELIAVYQRYLQGETGLLPLLLLHNEDDLLATFLLGHFLPFLETPRLKHFLFPYFDAFPHVEKADQVEPLTFYNPAWQDYLNRCFDSRCFSPLMTGSFLRRYPVRQTILYHFLPDPENYYYLPQEDTAVHSSVAQFVEPAFRRKATRKTAYIKKADAFLELPAAALPFLSEEPLFQTGYSDKKRYLPLSALTKYYSDYI